MSDATASGTSPEPAGPSPSHAGDLVGRVLAEAGVPALFTLCGGHISPILQGAKRQEIPVVDVRHEASALFAADACARLSGVPGVAAVTAGPGVTNTITALKNAQLAQSPVILLGGATATLLAGRGALQDIDQMALVRPHVKWGARVRRVRDVAPMVARAFAVARDGVPGPVFLELPVDLLYPEAVVRTWYAEQAGGGKGLSGRALQAYLNRHLAVMFGGRSRAVAVEDPQPPEPEGAEVRRAAAYLARAERPVVVVGSQAVLDPESVDRTVESLVSLGAPAYLSGMARGLLGARHPLWMRHKRSVALRAADFVLLLGVPNDFRMGYGRSISRKAVVVSANRSRRDLTLNRRPTVASIGDPARFLAALAAEVPSLSGRFDGWRDEVRARDQAREAEIAAQAKEPVEGGVSPLVVAQAIDDALPEDSVLVADGGDFVATASYVVRPRGPLRWLDPGVFGTLGVGGGFALGAKAARPSAEVWLLYGDGSAAFSIAEFDTCVRRGMPVLAVVGNDACWSQIARDQVEILGDDVGTTLRATDYHRVAEGYGGAGFEVREAAALPEALAQARAAVQAGKPALVNVHLARSDFRKGSLSI